MRIFCFQKNNIKYETNDRLPSNPTEISGVCSFDFILIIFLSKIMRPSEALQIYREQIRSVVMAHHATHVGVFGSVVRGKDTNESVLWIYSLTQHLEHH